LCADCNKALKKRVENKDGREVKLSTEEQRVWNLDILDKEEEIMKKKGGINANHVMRLRYSQVKSVLVVEII